MPECGGRAESILNEAEELFRWSGLSCVGQESRYQPRSIHSGRAGRSVPIVVIVGP